MLAGCTALPRVTGLLGITASPSALRTVSVTDLRYHKVCPAQAHLSSLSLPRLGYGADARLGQAVHGWLETLHGRDHAGACTAADMPPVGLSWQGGPWRVEGDDAMTGAQMLAHHFDICPLQGDEPVSQVRPEPRLAFHDPGAHAVVIAKPDLLYADHGAWVWREVKTTRKRDWPRGDLLEAIPQLALAVVLLAGGALGGVPEGSRVELEVLRPRGAEITLVDPADPQVVAKARELLGRMARPWREDELFEAQPGRECQRCLVSQWCPSFPGAGTE